MVLKFFYRTTGTSGCLEFAGSIDQIADSVAQLPPMAVEEGDQDDARFSQPELEEESAVSIGQLKRSSSHASLKSSDSPRKPFSSDETRATSHRSTSIVSTGSIEAYTPSMSISRFSSSTIEEEIEPILSHSSPPDDLERLKQERRRHVQEQLQLQVTNGSTMDRIANLQSQVDAMKQAKWKDEEAKTVKASDLPMLY